MDKILLPRDNKYAKVDEFYLRNIIIKEGGIINALKIKDPHYINIIQDPAGSAIGKEPPLSASGASGSIYNYFKTSGAPLGKIQNIKQTCSIPGKKINGDIAPVIHTHSPHGRNYPNKESFFNALVESYISAINEYEKYKSRHLRLNLVPLSGNIYADKFEDKKLGHLNPSFTLLAISKAMEQKKFREEVNLYYFNRNTAIEAEKIKKSFIDSVPTSTSSSSVSSSLPSVNCETLGNANLISICKWYSKDEVLTIAGRNMKISDLLDQLDHDIKSRESDKKKLFIENVHNFISLLFPIYWSPNRIDMPKDLDYDLLVETIVEIQNNCDKIIRAATIMHTYFDNLFNFGYFCDTSYSHNLQRITRIMDTLYFIKEKYRIDDIIIKYIDLIKKLVNLKDSYTKQSEIYWKRLPWWSDWIEGYHSSVSKKKYQAGVVWGSNHNWFDYDDGINDQITTELNNPTGRAIDIGGNYKILFRGHGAEQTRCNKYLEKKEVIAIQKNTETKNCRIVTEVP